MYLAFFPPKKPFLWGWGNGKEWKEKKGRETDGQWSIEGKSKGKGKRLLLLSIEMLKAAILVILDHYPLG